MRIAGITIPDNKRLEISLTALYGIGRARARTILHEANIDIVRTTKDLSSQEEKSIRKIIEGYQTEGNLKRDIAENIKRLKDIKTNRGIRHGKHLPVRGQRTKTNSRTARGNVRRTMGSGKRKLEKK